MTDKLSRNNAEFGKALVSEANKQSQEARQKRLIERVRYIVDAIQQAEENIAKNREGIEFFKKQIAAINKGDFVFGPGDEIIFGNEDIRKQRPFS
jgi:hypothetical protein